MYTLTADGYPMTTTNPPGIEGGNVWVQDIASLEPDEMPWYCYPFGAQDVAERVVQQVQSLTFAEFNLIFEPIP